MNSSSTAAAAKLKAAEDDDSNVYEQADSIYETILDADSPYSQLPSQPPPLPDPNTITKCLPSPTKEPENTSQATCKDPEACSKTQFSSTKDFSKRCPSPVDYSLLNPNAAPSPPGCAMEYASVDDTLRTPAEVDTNDDYVPMYDDTQAAREGVDCNTPKSMYQNIGQGTLDKESHYQVPRPVNVENEGQEKQHHYANFAPEMKQ